MTHLTIYAVIIGALLGIVYALLKNNSYLRFKCVQFQIRMFRPDICPEHLVYVPCDECTRILWARNSELWNLAAETKKAEEETLEELREYYLGE